ncbi:MAG: GNAT family N-acetyltransferase [Ignavibacteriaceae bacterium]
MVQINDQLKIKSKYSFFPVTKERWKDFEQLFGKNGACAGCWCMYWRVSHKIFDKQKGAGNKKAIKKIIIQEKIPGILAYDDLQPVGWCSIAPREEFTRLENSRILKPVDNKYVWSVTCFFINRKYRNKGLSADLLNASKKLVKARGGRIIEGYPIEPRKNKIPDAFAWVGLSGAFLKTGFKEVARRSETRPIMRYTIA